MAPRKKGDDVDQLIADVEKRYEGRVLLRKAEDVPYIYDLRRPIGIFSLDLAIGGGFPAGTINQVFGPEAAGKNFAMYSTGAQTQQIYGEQSRICILSLGYGFDRQHARNAGLQIAYTKEELAYVEEQHKKMGVKVPDELMAELTHQPGHVAIIELGEGKEVEERPTEIQLQLVIDMIRSNKFQLVLVDEAVGAGPTKDALKVEMGKPVQMGDQARMLSEFCRRYFNAIAPKAGVPNLTTVVAAVQARANLSQYGPDLIVTGGYALKHAKALDVHLFSSSAIKDSKERKIGKMVRWRIDKAKLGTHEGASGKFPFYFNKAGYVDHLEDVAMVAKGLGLLKKRGMLYDIIDAEGNEMMKGIKGGVAGVVKRMKKEEELMEHLRGEAIKKSGAQWRVM